MTDPADKLEPFMCEPRYVVLKRKDLCNLTPTQQRHLGEITQSHDLRRQVAGKPELEVVVVESDWPEYEPTWAAIEARVNRENPQ